MNTLTKGFAKRVLSMLLVTIMVFSLGLVGITSASAAETELAETGVNTVAGGHVYFDNSKTGWTDSSIQFVIGHSSFSRTYVMSKVANTNLYYVNLSNSTYHDWGDATYYAVVGTSSKWGDGDWGSSNLTSANHYTAAYTTAYNMSADTDYHLVTTTGSANGTTINITYQASGYSSLNHTQYAYSYAASYGSTAYSANGSAGTVSVSGKYLSAATSLGSRSDTSTGGTDYTASAALARTTTVTLTATPADGYEFVGWSTSASETYIVSESTTYTYASEINGQKYYALFKVSTPPVSIENATATAPESGTIGTPVDITLDYTVTGSDSTPTYELLLNDATYTSSYTSDVENKTITVSPTIAGTYNFSVKITVDGVSVTTDAVSITFRDELAATLSADKNSAYDGESITLTVDDNSEQYGTATYTLYNAADNSVVESDNTTGTFTVTPAVGTHAYYVVVTAGDQTATTNTVEITVKEKIFSVTLDAPEAVVEDREFTVTATVMFAPEGEELTYTLTGSDGTSYTSTDGVFTVVANTAGEVIYTVTVTASGGASVTDTATVTVNVDLGTYPVKIFFKCSDTFGYRPNAKIDGTAVELTKSDVIITKNSTDTAEYYWYSYTSATDVDFGTQIKFAVNANRNYFYNVSYTVSAGEGDYVLDGEGYYCYYLAVENLNGGTNTLTNISTLTEDQRNWTESAVNMIYNADTDALAETALNYSYAAYGDANCDGKLNIKDATYIQKSLAKIVETSELSAIVSDFNQDGDVTIKDATAIQKQLANL